MSVVSILKEFKRNVESFPDKTLYAFLDIHGEISEEYTYLSFDFRTDQIASLLQNDHKLLPGERVLLSYPPGLEFICGFFACLKIGVIPVPVPGLESNSYEGYFQQIQQIANDCDAVGVLTNTDSFNRIHLKLSLNDSNGQIHHNWIPTDRINHESMNFKTHDNEILFIQYTSGSTSKPKGVVVSHQNVLCNYPGVVNHDPIGVSWLPQYHDMGLIGYYLFFAICGGTTYGFSPKHFIQRPTLWFEAISKYRGTATSAPNFGFQYCLSNVDTSDAKWDLSSLKFVMNAAEPVKIEICEAFLDRYASFGLDRNAFFSAYGLAENTLAVSSQGRKYINVSRDRLQHGVVSLDREINDSTVRFMSAGKVIDGVEVKIVDPVTLDLVSEQRVGEIWIQGGSKCLGYWNYPDLNAKVFKAKLSGTKGEWLRTGDLGFFHEGELYISGRLKDLIIVRGKNYYPQDFESIIEKDDFVRNGHVAVVQNTENPQILAIVGLRNKHKIPETNELNHQLVNHIGIGVDTFYFVTSNSIWKTSSGKIMRFRNLEALFSGELEIIKKVEMSASAPSEMKGPSAFQLLLNKYGLDGTENTTFGEVGMDSIKMVSLFHDLKGYLESAGLNRISRKFELKYIQKLSINELSELLQDLQQRHDSNQVIHISRLENVLQKIQEQFTAHEHHLMKQDAELSFPMDTPKVMNRGSSKLLKVFLTGGTGFLGPFLMDSLLEQHDCELYVLVRADCEKEGFDRLRNAYTAIASDENKVQRFEKQVTPIIGDLSTKQLGLTNDYWNFLTSNIDVIYHNGAEVNYLKDYTALRNPNVLGTSEIIKLANFGLPKTLNFISTTFIFGWSVKDILYEPDMNDEMENLDFGYSQSKWVSERLVQNAISAGLKGRIFRPALISPTIKGLGFNYDIAVRLLTFMIQEGLTTDASNQVSFVPADIVAHNVVAISSLNESIGQTFHVTRSEFVAMKDITDIMGQFTTTSFRNFPLSDFVSEVVASCTKEDILFPLLDFLVKSENKIKAMEYKLYDNSNYRHFCSKSSVALSDPPMEDIVKGILIFLKKEGIINLNMEFTPITSTQE